MFAITSGVGFHVTFPNGVTLSTQFGSGTYCNNHDFKIGSMQRVDQLESGNAEIAIWDKDGEWLTKQAYKETFDEELHDDVKGYVEIMGWYDILNWCHEYGRAKEEKEVEEENGG